MSGVGASTGSAGVMGATVSEPTTVPELVEGTGTLYGVGVGPGDPELMTLKAARLIGSSPVVAYHQARGKQSNARGIAASLIGPESIEEVLEYPVTSGTTAHPGGYEGALAEFYDEAAERLGFGHRNIASGAGHDAVYTARICPTTMIFVPCKDGISHNEAEESTFEQCAAGTQVLLNAVLAYDAMLEA